MPYVVNLKPLRTELGWSQSELARSADIDRGTVSRCENGYSIVELSCSKIIRALKKEAAEQKISLGEIVVDPEGKPGEIPKKGRKNPKKTGGTQSPRISG